MMIFFLNHTFMSFWKLSLILIFKLGLMMFYSLNTFFNNMTFNLGCDIMSMFMITLSIFIFSLSILASKHMLFKEMFFFFIMLLLKILIILFASNHLFIFYVFFEFSLIPMMMLILGWGMKVERMQASIYFLFYTMFSSLPLLYQLTFYMFFNYSNFMFFYNTSMFFNFSTVKDFFFIFFFTFAFLVKMPIFMFHLWLPKAHVEAPVGASMILAGILLKLGSYGLMRIMIIIMENLYKYSTFLISFSLWGGFIISISCLNQLDMKMIVAFSSVSHMSLLIMGLYSMSKMGFYGSFLIMIAHGLSSSGLFFLVNVFYERTNSRSLLFNKGIINLSPNLSLVSFLIISSSMAVPPTINLMSEFLLSYSLMYYSFIFMVLLFFMLLISVCYSMYMYSFSQHGKLFSGMYFFKNMYVIEYFNICMHWVPLNFMIIKSDILSLYF
uniref:NADH-ubiquinone oxidoreductase chain 4 n=1 Tax=Psephenothrips eriobotryae TaxID=2913602 RepID=A0A9E6YDF6_9NEOP|nr:NADH dehydrogenase subunit 4 [Psephenothrips eriobotryae]UJY97335.1 NADH dehydrogenase subunit 4 [Psephenothrips eriobotryae]